MSTTYLKRFALIFLIFTTILGIFLRFYKITSLEPYIDEASIGYNAYTLTSFQTDEWGSTWPLHFQAFGEWKLPVYIYLTAITSKIIGFNTLSIRLPSVLAGLGISFLIFLTLKKLTRSLNLSLLGTNIYLFNFWSFMLSRGGFEANLALFFTLLALFIYFLTSIKPNLKILLTSILLILGFFTYNSARLLNPIFFIIITIHFLVTHKPNPKGLFKTLFIPSFSWLITAFLTWRFYQNPTALTRFNQVSTLPSSLDIFLNYLQSFSYAFWVGQGDNIPRHTQPGFGNTDLVSYFLFIFGFIFLIFKKQFKTLFIFLGLRFIALIPGLITTHPLHNLRNIFILPLFLSLTLYPLTFLFRLRTPGVRQKSNPGGSEGAQFLTLCLINTLLLTFTLPFFINYFTQYIKDPTLSWGTGYKQLIQQLTIKHPNQHIYIDTKRVQPYIYWAWYLKTPPSHLVRNTPDKWHLSSVAQIDNYFFTPIKTPQHCYKNICYTIKQ